MKKQLFQALVSLSCFVILLSTAFAHCEIPCGPMILSGFLFQRRRFIRIRT